jgi:septal ring factor EnvC (AmiA/AmiB activator)
MKKIVFSAIVLGFAGPVIAQTANENVQHLQQDWASQMTAQSHVADDMQKLLSELKSAQDELEKTKAELAKLKAPEPEKKP